MTVHNLISFSGIFILMGFGWLFSTNRKVINWKVVIGGTLLQMLTALFIFKVPFGVRVFMKLNTAVIRIMDCAAAGTQFLFGPLAQPPFILAFQALPTIIFFSSLMSILYYLKIMPWLIRKFSLVFTKIMRLSGAESLAAASNIFSGVESALTIQPHLLKMTKSELCVVLTAGMATTASNVLALYVFMLKDHFPTIAGHLVSASLLSAPAAIVLSKLIVPETDSPETLGTSVEPHYQRDQSLFEAVINGANSGVKMIVGIAALLVAVLGLVALADLFISFAGDKLNSLLNIRFDWSLRNLCGYLFYPLTLITGVPFQDAPIISKIIGERMVVTEVVSYQDLALALSNNRISDFRSVVIATYALCGFAHIASMAIFVGGTAALAAERTKDLTRIAPRALLAATLACLMTGSIAGAFFSQGSILFSGR